MTLNKHIINVKPLATVAVVALLISLFVMSPVFAASTVSKEAACEGIGLSGASCGRPNSTNPVISLVGATVNVLSVVVGIAAVVMIIVSGFKYITSGGDANKVSSAKSTLIYAVVGIVIVVLSQFIVRFVLGAASV